MRLHYVLLMVVATLVASNGAVSAARATDGAKLWKVTAEDQIHSIDMSHTHTRNKRMLRGVGTNNGGGDAAIKKEGKRPFIEDKLLKALANPKTRMTFYKRWYKSGYSTEQVAGGLNQNENKELFKTYKNLAKEYAAYVKDKRPQQKTR